MSDCYDDGDFINFDKDLDSILGKRNKKIDQDQTFKIINKRVNNTQYPNHFDGPGCRVYFFIQGIATWTWKHKPMIFAPGSTIVPKHGPDFEIIK